MLSFLPHVFALASLTITPAEFEKLHQDLQPPVDELWSSIPWEISIHQAQVRAAEEKKPLFMWVMNGNPCGTT